MKKTPVQIIITGAKMTGIYNGQNNKTGAPYSRVSIHPAFADCMEFQADPVNSAAIAKLDGQMVDVVGFLEEKTQIFGGKGEKRVTYYLDTVKAAGR